MGARSGWRGGTEQASFVRIQASLWTCGCGRRGSRAGHTSVQWWGSGRHGRPRRWGSGGTDVGGDLGFELDGVPVGGDRVLDPFGADVAVVQPTPGGPKPIAPGVDHGASQSTEALCRLAGRAVLHRIPCALSPRPDSFWRMIVLVAPPFLRLVGSHNDRVPLELAYLQAHLRRAGVDAVLLNADSTGATAYHSWRQLFINSGYLALAARGKSPLIDETIERVMSYPADAVVIAAGDSVTPWVDAGNPYVAACLSRRLRRLGVYTVGIGPFFREAPDAFAPDFDALLSEPASPTIVDVVRERPRGHVRGLPHDLTVVPDLEVEPTCGRDDVVVTAMGCPFRCAFCFARRSQYRPIPFETVGADVLARKADQLDLGDAVLPVNADRLRGLIQTLAPFRRTYSCEIAVSTATAARLSMLRELGVWAVKLGVESGSQAQLDGWDKKQSVSATKRAAARIKEYGFHLTAYILLGGPNATIADARATLALCKDLPADDYVINVFAYHGVGDRPALYDSHFSQALVDQYGLGDVIDEFFALQAPAKAGLGPLLPSE